jgi:hypothetical protein
VYGGLVLMLANIAAVLIAGTPTWMNTAKFLQSLAG